MTMREQSGSLPPPTPIPAGTRKHGARWPQHNKDWPFDTVRGHFPDDINPVFATQVRDYQDGLRRLGERDHADEDADFGVSADARPALEPCGLYADHYSGRANHPYGRTPRDSSPSEKPVIIDPIMHFWGRSISGAVGLRNCRCRRYHQ